LGPMVNILPAKARCEGNSICGGDSPPPSGPAGLTVH